MNAVAEMEKPVVERIADAVRSEVTTAAELQTLWDEASNMRRGMAEAEADCMKQALDPSNSVAEARTSRQSAEDFAHGGRRLDAAIAAVDERLPVQKAAEHRERIMPAYLAYKLERTQFALRIAERWPKLTAEMIELLHGIDKFDQTPPCEIPDGEDPLRISVEAMARGISGNFHTAETPPRPLVRLGQARLPNFKSPDFAWSEYSR